MVKRSGLEGDNTLLVLSSIYNSLSKTEKKIADVIVKDPNSVVYATVTDMAEITSVGETSVLRLCRRLGFRSYQEFKLSLAKELVNPAKNIYNEIEETDDFKAIARKVTIENNMALENTLSLLNDKELEKSIKAIVQAKRIYFFGIGSSGTVALDGKYRFLRMGLNVDAVSDSHYMSMTSTLLTKEDVVIGISTSGSTKDIVDAVRIAKNNGVFFVCITSQSRSPLAQFADTLLLINSKESPLQGGAFSSKMSQIHVLDILSTILVLNTKEKAYQALERTAKGVADKLY